MEDQKNQMRISLRFSSVLIPLIEHFSGIKLPTDENTPSEIFFEADAPEKIMNLLELYLKFKGMPSFSGFKKNNNDEADDSGMGGMGGIGGLLNDLMGPLRGAMGGGKFSSESVHTDAVDEQLDGDEIDKVLNSSE